MPLTDTPVMGGVSHYLNLVLADRFPPWLRHEIMGISTWQFMGAFLFILLGMSLKRLSEYVLEQKLLPLLRKSPWSIDNLFVSAASRPIGFLCLLAGIAGAFLVLPLPLEPVNVHAFVFGLLQLALVSIVIWFLFRLIDMLVLYLTELSARTESKLDSQVVPIIRNSLKATVGIIGVLWVLQLFGYSISSILAGLGIGGLAVALALQDTLSNFFGSVFIFIDRPFVVGDWIKMGEVEGVVEDVGFRSTRIRTFPKTVAVIPNRTVANATIDNHTRMPRRRVLQQIGVTYETTAAQMEELVEKIRELVVSDPGVHDEFIASRFTDFGDSSLNITVIYFTTEIGFVEHSEVKQRINLGIMRLVKEMGLSIAFPTRTVYFEGDVARGMGGRTGAPPGGKVENKAAGTDETARPEDTR